MEGLSLSAKAKTRPAAKESVADSWEDEDVSSSGEDTETEGPSIRSVMPGPPPPTPVTPGYKNIQDSVEFEDPYAVKDAPSRSSARGPNDGRRQEKQTATASRLIAGALGVRAPKRTEEQRAYDRAIREKEQKKKDKEKEERKKEEEEKEKLKASVWDD